MKITITGNIDGGKMLKRKVWVRTDFNEIGEHHVTECFLRKTKYTEEAILFYPRYAVGRAGEGGIVHLPSFPERIKWRALTADIDEDKLK